MDDLIEQLKEAVRDLRKKKASYDAAYDEAHKGDSWGKRGQWMKDEPNFRYRLCLTEKRIIDLAKRITDS